MRARQSKVKESADAKWTLCGSKWIDVTKVVTIVASEQQRDVSQRGID